MRKRFFFLLGNSSQQVRQKYLCLFLSINNTCKNFDKALRRCSQDFTMFAPRTHNEVTWFSKFSLPIFVLISVSNFPWSIKRLGSFRPNRSFIIIPTIQRYITCTSVFHAMQDTPHDNICMYYDTSEIFFQMSSLRFCVHHCPWCSFIADINPLLWCQSHYKKEQPGYLPPLISLHSTQTSAEVKKTWIYTSHSSTRLHGVVLN
jgi:hypothetical protein